ncbi:MAG TPA: CHRD domain-containing protein [Thermosynechococcaceae cyanobacterium]
MRQFWTIAALSSALVASAPLAAQAASFTFSGPLSGAQEAPAPNNSPATGSFLATLTGEPEQWTFNYQVSFQNLTGLFRDGHIHLGGRGVSGPVVHPLDGVPALVAARVNTGSLTGEWTSAEVPATATPAAVFQRFLAGQYYFNVHSTTFPGGEIRGQIENPTTSAAVPEPVTTVGLLVAGAIGAAARRKKAKQV